MATNNTGEITLRVFVDSEMNKVLFAEADNDFVDILLSFMTLPLGTIVRLTDKHPGPQKKAIGSFNTLYDSLKKLSSTHFSTEEAKLMLLYPKNSSEIEFQKLKINVDTESTKYHICEYLNCSQKNSGACVSVSTYNVTRCSCGKLMNREIDLKSSIIQGKEGGFTIGMTSFIITDDLQIMPNFAGSSLKLLKSLGIKHLSVIQERSFSIELHEVVSLLKCLTFSRTPLSDVFLHTESLKLETVFSDTSFMSDDTKANTGKMVLKVIVHKTTKKEHSIVRN